MKKLLIASLIASVLAGCGGSSGGSSAPAPTPEPDKPNTDIPWTPLDPADPIAPDFSIGDLDSGFVSAMNQKGFSDDEIVAICQPFEATDVDIEYEVYCGDNPGNGYKVEVRFNSVEWSSKTDGVNTRPDGYIKYFLGHDSVTIYSGFAYDFKDASLASKAVFIKPRAEGILDTSSPTLGDNSFDYRGVTETLRGVPVVVVREMFSVDYDDRALFKDAFSHGEITALPYSRIIKVPRAGLLVDVTASTFSSVASSSFHDINNPYERISKIVNVVW